MSHFTPVLKNINDRLNLPQPIKSRIILEIAADLEDTFSFYQTKGYSPKEAHQKTIARLNLTDETLNELVQIHQSGWRKFLNRLSEQAQTRWERFILFLVLIFIAAVGGKAIFSTQFFLQASKFIWPILGIFLGIIIIALSKFYQFYIKKDHYIRHLRTGISLIPVLGGVNLFVGVSGYILELYSTTRTTMYSGVFDVITTVVEVGDVEFFGAVEHVLKCASMAMTCTFVTIFTALLWFVLITKIHQIEQAEMAFLIES